MPRTTTSDSTPVRITPHCRADADGVAFLRAKTRRDLTPILREALYAAAIAMVADLAANRIPAIAKNTKTEVARGAGVARWTPRIDSTTQDLAALIAEELGTFGRAPSVPKVLAGSLNWWLETVGLQRAAVHLGVLQPITWAQPATPPATGSLAAASLWLAGRRNERETRQPLRIADLDKLVAEEWSWQRTPSGVLESQSPQAALAALIVVNLAATADENHWRPLVPDALMAVTR